MKNNQKKTKRKGKSVQDLLGIKTFTKNGLKVGKEEFIFYMVQPTIFRTFSHEYRNQGAAPDDGTFCCAGY